MTKKERILFATLIGSLSAATLAGHVLMREYDRATNERDDLYTQIAGLIAFMAQNGLDVNVFDGLTTVTRTTGSTTTDEP